MIVHTDKTRGTNGDQERKEKRTENAGYVHKNKHKTYVVIALTICLSLQQTKSSINIDSPKNACRYISLQGSCFE